MKRTFFLTMIMGLAALLWSACHTSPSIISATGMPYEVEVVTTRALWDDTVGVSLRAELQRPISGLPQAEPSMRVTFVTPDDFNGLTTYVRNIIILTVDAERYTKLSVRAEKDRWATGQVVVYISAQDEASVLTYLADHRGALTDYFTRLEMMRMAQVMQETYSSLVMD